MPSKKVKEIDTHAYVEDVRPIWVNKKKLKNELLEDQAGTKLMMKFWDIPGVTDHSKESDEFFKALADVSDEKTSELQIFAEPIVQIVIRKAWREQKLFFYIFLFLPAFINLVLFTVWSNILTVDLEQTLGIFDSKEL